MTPQELWSNVHNNYGADLGCSSDEDYVKPGEISNYPLELTCQRTITK